MRTWTAVAVVGIAAIAIGLLASTGFAYASGQQSDQQYGPYSSTSVPGAGGGMMGGALGGMMGSGNSSQYCYSMHNGSSDQQYMHGANGYGRCMGAIGLP